MAVFLAGIAAAMVITQHLRSEGPIASQIYFKSAAGPRYRVCFQTPRDDSFEVAIVDSSGRVVRILAADVPLRGDPTPDKESAHCFDWDGIDEAGAPVPAGSYRLRLALEAAERRAVSGEKLRITEPASAPVAPTANGQAP